MLLLKKLWWFFTKFRKDLVLLISIYGDNKMPRNTKLVLGLALLYFICPIDLIPEAFVPFIGSLDDAVILPLAIHWAVNNLPESVRREGEHKAHRLEKRMPVIIALAVCFVLLWIGLIAYSIYLLFSFIFG